MVRSAVLLKSFGKWPRTAACPQAIRQVACLPWAILAFVLPGVAIDSPQLSGTVTADGLRLNINGEASQPYTVQVSRDLKHWIPAVTTETSRGVFPPNDRFEWMDREFLFGGERFYRAVRSASASSETNAQDIIVSDRLLTLYEGGAAN